MGYKYNIILVLFLLSLAASLILAFEKDSVICKGTDCETVKNSKYAFAFGVKNSHLGVIIFALTSLLIYSYIKKPTKNKKLIISLSIIIGSLIVLFFLYIQAFVLKAYCSSCLVIDFSMLLSLLILFFGGIKV